MNAHETTPAVQLEPLVSVNEAGRLLGVSRNTLWRIIRRGELAVVAVGGRTMVVPAELRAFIERNVRPFNEQDSAGRPSLATASADGNSGHDEP